MSNSTTIGQLIKEAISVGEANQMVMGDRTYPFSAVTSELKELLEARTRDEIAEEFGDTAWTAQAYLHQRGLYPGAMPLLFGQRSMDKYITRADFITDELKKHNLEYSHDIKRGGSNWVKPAKVMAAFELAGKKLSPRQAQAISNRYSKLLEEKKTKTASELIKEADGWGGRAKSVAKGFFSGLTGDNSLPKPKPSNAVEVLSSAAGGKGATEVALSTGEDLVEGQIGKAMGSKARSYGGKMVSGVSKVVGPALEILGPATNVYAYGKYMHDVGDKIIKGTDQAFNNPRQRSAEEVKANPYSTSMLGQRYQRINQGKANAAAANANFLTNPSIPEPAPDWETAGTTQPGASTRRPPPGWKPSVDEVTVTAPRVAPKR